MGWSFFICSIDLKLFWDRGQKTTRIQKVSIRMAMPQFPTKEWKKARMVSRGLSISMEIKVTIMVNSAISP